MTSESKNSAAADNQQGRVRENRLPEAGDPYSLAGLTVVSLRTRVKQQLKAVDFDDNHQSQQLVEFLDAR